MSTRKLNGIPLSSLHPNFLHTNSTSHTWPFSAIAELVDNAYDPDVHAKQFWIDWTHIKGLDCLSFMDNGAGMTRARLRKMLSFGYSEKEAVKGHVPVGVYGNGFKSGSMRLGKDAIIFTKTRATMSIGLLSQSYLQSIKAQQIKVPIITFRRDGCNDVEDVASLNAILSYSLFRTEKELFSEMRAISAIAPTGTRIIIWNLRKTTSGKTEFDFDADRYDIQIRVNTSEMTKESRAMMPESAYSLRAYCSILYLKPRMQINIRGHRVKSQLISKSLAHIVNDNYRPSFLTRCIHITFGFNTKCKEHYGIMMYHRNRLIKAYERVSCQRKAESTGVGVIGVIECNFLQPTHNKQDFDDTDKYRKTMRNLSIKLEEYWNEIHYKYKFEDPKNTVPIEDTVKVPDQIWVQCDSCLKWRRLPDGFDCSRLSEKWFCNMNHDPQFRNCMVEEELEDQEEKSYPKPFKRQKRNSKSLQEESVPEELVTLSPVSPLPTRQTKNTPFWQTSLSEPSSSQCPRSSLPLINLTDISDKLKRMKRKHSTTEGRHTASGTSVHSYFSPMVKENGSKSWGTELTETFEPYQEPVEEDEEGWHDRGESDSTEIGYHSNPVESEPNKKCEKEMCDVEEKLRTLQQQQVEMMEMMGKAVDDRDACRVEMEMLRKHCATLEDSRSQLLSKLEKVEKASANLSTQRNQLKCELAKLKGGKNGEDGAVEEQRHKLRTLRRNLGHLLAFFMSDLNLEQIDFNSEVIDKLLEQVLEEICLKQGKTI